VPGLLAQRFQGDDADIADAGQLTNMYGLSSFGS